MKKTLVYTLVLCFGLGVCLAGCGGTEKKPTTPTKTGTSETTKTPPEKAPK